jgi:DNA repair protein RadD
MTGVEQAGGHRRECHRTRGHQHPHGRRGWTRVYAPTLPDLRGIRARAGDYVETQLADVMDARAWSATSSPTGTGWPRFIKSGVSCEHFDGATPKEERDDVLRMLATGAIDVVTNCMVLTEGWDMPDVGCCVLARPTRKMGLYRQMIGRVLRPAAGKPDAIVIDHSGAVHRHGFVEDRVDWTLDPERQAENPTHASRSIGEFRSRLVDRAKCGALRTGGEPCRHCGFMPTRPPKYVPVIDADLQRVSRDVAVNVVPDKASWYAQLAFIERERGYKPGWARWRYKEKFGVWPSYSVCGAPKEATPEVRSWVRSRMIAYAKSQQRAAL